MEITRSQQLTTPRLKLLQIGFAHITTQYQNILKDYGKRASILLSSQIQDSTYEFYRKQGKRLFLVQQHCPADKWDTLELNFLHKLTTAEYAELTGFLDNLTKKRLLVPQKEHINLGPLASPSPETSITNGNYSHFAHLISYQLGY